MQTHEFIDALFGKDVLGLSAAAQQQQQQQQKAEGTACVRTGKVVPREGGFWRYHAPA